MSTIQTEQFETEALAPTLETLEVESQGEEESAGIGALGIDGRALIFQIINFVILFIILKKFVFSPLAKVIQDRNQQIAESVKNAKAIENQKHEWEEKQKQLLQETSRNSAEIIEKSRKDSQSQKEIILEEAKKERDDIIAATQKEIATQKQQLLAEVKKDVVDMVVAVTEKITRQTLSGKDQKELIIKTLKENQ